LSTGRSQILAELVKQGHLNEELRAYTSVTLIEYFCSLFDARQNLTLNEDQSTDIVVVDAEEVGVEVAEG
jgi:hypothetical protein